MPEVSESPSTVSDVMTQTVVSVGRDASFKEIVGLIDQWRVSALPVLEGEGRVVGVVSEADLLAKEEFRDTEPVLLQARPSSTGDPFVARTRRLADLAKAGAVTAGELMTSPAITVRADATVAQAARIMAQRGIKRLPVTDVHGILQGIVSRSDLLKVFLRTDEDIAQEVRNTVLAQLTPARLRASVDDGVVTLSGDVRDRSLVPTLARLTRAVEGVVDVHIELAGQGSS
ncbi:CBS domain-containing protein [Streptomyces sporangiiformans]|uniref:CBS domain-containing protein n=1 Tax=Streptomyces sporangiiformans TaxID=2315329 RepID=A0A505DJX3_9ACTN|nr:CBS domain-containing protein [Streptomyces sporangiiformans]TPQ21448.1 CBS domain-containing protein [Streptomyces sporangiiformans]